MIIKDYLKSQGHSNKECKSLLDTGKVFLQGMPTSDGRRECKEKDLEIRPRAPRMKPGRDPVVLHKGEGFVVCYKPAGYLSVRAANRHKDPNMMGFVYTLLGEAHAVHRLDEETSGLMLIATDVKTQELLKGQLERREVERRYWALASGHISKELTIDNILFRNRGDGKRGSAKVRSEEGKRAISHFKPLEKLNGATLVQCQLQTGRTHQIRIHLAEKGHPVLGEKLYSSPRMSERSPRLALHAYSLSFQDPKSGVSLLFRIPFADDLDKLRRTLAYKERSADSKRG
jgi:23S rRNA pseudouridine1911/1915/1917 synthase